MPLATEKVYRRRQWSGQRNHAKGDLLFPRDGQFLPRAQHFSEISP